VLEYQLELGFFLQQPKNPTEVGTLNTVIFKSATWFPCGTVYKQ